MGTGNLKIDYTWQGDYLSLWNDHQGPVKARDVSPDSILTAFHSPSGECRGFDLFDAAQMLIPLFKGEASPGELRRGELWAGYDANTDTLELLGNRHTPALRETVADGFTAHCTEPGRAVGFTLDRAAELLMPYLKSWRPWTAEEWAAIRQRMDSQDTAIRARAASKP